MKRLLLLFAVTTGLFGQCSRLVLNPLTGRFDCVGSSSSSSSTASQVTATSTVITMAAGGVWTPSTLNVVFSSAATITRIAGTDTDLFTVGYNSSGQRVCFVGAGATISNYTVSAGFQGSTCVTPVPSTGIWIAGTVAVTGGAFNTTPTDLRTDGVVAIVLAGSGLTCTGATCSADTTLIDGSIAYCADAGANDTYSCSLAVVPGAYVTGAHYRFKANTANTGACTVNFNTLGAKSIVKVAGGIATALADNDIRVGQVVDLVYDGTNMQMQSLLGNAPSAGATTVIAHFGGLTGGCNSGTVFAALWTLTNFDFFGCTATSHLAIVKFDNSGTEDIQTSFIWPSNVTSVSATAAYHGDGAGSIVTKIEIGCKASLTDPDTLPTFDTAVSDTVVIAATQINYRPYASIGFSGCTSGLLAFVRYSKDNSGSPPAASIYVEAVDIFITRTLP